MLSVRILTEASGSLTSAYLQKAIGQAGHISVGSDIHDQTSSLFLSDDFIIFPPKDDPELWVKVEQLLLKHRIDIVIPTFDEMMGGWAERKDHFSNLGIDVIISPMETIRIFQDKWLTYLFFIDNNIPTPQTSLEQKYRLIKPRHGRGSTGIKITDQPVDMTGIVSQEIVSGEEYTIDAFFDYQGKPVYIVPRKRLHTVEGKSVHGITVKHQEMENYVQKISEVIQFIGAINLQCFSNGKNIWFTEVNPRFGGGTALGMAATENWINIIVDNLIRHKPIEPKTIKYGLRMIRYYTECFVS